jgi:hypothetical protein
MKMSYANFAVGLLYGFGLGVLLDQADFVNVTSFSLLLGGLILVPALGWLEARSHRRRMMDWGRIRERGKFIFIALHYVLFRGGIFALIMMFLLRGQLTSWYVHGITVPVVVFALAFVGLQEWNNCEQESQPPSPARRMIDVAED